MPLTALPEALTLDVGHTLLFPDPPLGEMYARKLPRFGIQVQPAWVDREFARAWEAARDGQPGLVYGTTHAEGLAFWIEVNRRLLAGFPLSPTDLHSFVADLYDSYARAANWRVAPGLDHLLQICAELAIPVALLSNWGQRLRELLRELDLVDRFQVIVISAEVGIEKPAPGIFACALRALDRPAARTVHVGDTWQDDILGAHAAGMKAIWIAPDSARLPQPLPGVDRVASVEEIAQVLAQALDAVG